MHARGSPHCGASVGVTLSVVTEDVLGHIVFSAAAQPAGGDYIGLLRPHLLLSTLIHTNLYPYAPILSKNHGIFQTLSPAGSPVPAGLMNYPNLGPEQISVFGWQIFDCAITSSFFIML